jgi:hypothetical protein
MVTLCYGTCKGCASSQLCHLRVAVHEQWMAPERSNVNTAVELGTGLNNQDL